MDAILDYTTKHCEQASDKVVPVKACAPGYIIFFSMHAT